MPPGPADEGSEEDPERRKAEGPPDEKILSPEELDFTEDEKVEQLDEGKFVIGTGDRPNVPPEERADKSTGAIPRSSSRAEGTDTPPTNESNIESESPAFEESGSSVDRSNRDGEISGRQVKDFLSGELKRTDSQYAYRIAAKTGDSVSHQQMASDDIGMAFDGLLMWYAQQVGAETSVEEALGILLAKSNIRIRYPPKLLTGFLREHEFERDDTIDDLLEVVKAEGGMVFPPNTK